MKKLSSILVVVVMTIVVTTLNGCSGYSASQNNEVQEEYVNIPRTHWNITLGQSRAEVKAYLKRLGNPKMEKSKVYGETWDEIKLRKTHTEYPKGEVVDYELEGSKEYYSISIQWFDDKVACILVNPFGAETIAEGVRMKYPLQEYQKGGDTLDEYTYFKYQNDSTRLIMVEHKDWKELHVYGFGAGDLRVSRRSEPLCSYDFIYQDLQLLSQKAFYEDSVKRTAEQKKKADAVEKASKY